MRNFRCASEKCCASGLFCRVSQMRSCAPECASEKSISRLASPFRRWDQLPVSALARTSTNSSLKADTAERVIGIPVPIVLGEGRIVFPLGVTNIHQDCRPDERPSHRRVGPRRDRERPSFGDVVKRIVPDAPRSIRRQPRFLLRPSLTQRQIP